MLQPCLLYTWTRDAFSLQPPHFHQHCFSYSDTLFVFDVPQAAQSPCGLVYWAGIQSMAPFFDQHPICELCATHQWILQSIEFNGTFHHLDFCEGACAYGHRRVCDVWWRAGGGGGGKECSLALIDTSPLPPPTPPHPPLLFS